MIIVSLPSYTEKFIGSHGHISCGSFLSACDSNLLDVDCQTQTFFAMGYLSSVMWENDIPLTKFDSDSVKYAMINFCRNNPLKSTLDGTWTVLEELK